MEQAIIIRLLVTLILASLVGYERERSLQHAGLRTHVLVAIGSCMVSIMSIMIYKEYSGEIARFDPARMSAQVLSGIGFLGAGAILKNSNTIKGLTTAASIWVISVVGLCIGFGYFYLGISAWFMLIVTLNGMRIMEQKFLKNEKVNLFIKVRSLNKSTPAISNCLVSNGLVMKKMDVLQTGDYQWSVNLVCSHGESFDMEEIIYQLWQIVDVESIEYFIS